MNIRRATLEDAPALARVHVQSWLETYAGLLPQGVLDSITVESREQQWEQTFARANDVLIVELGDTVVGFASVGQPRDEGVDVELFTLYLLKAHQGKGWGRALWDAALEAARSRSAKTLGLWVLESNPTRVFTNTKAGRSVNARPS
ncbi:MAG: GNAT family N-acetyltransferase [Pleurocapsa sp. SU_196_0]|nr:GNAT family N-acetyltransferase [Pleurocapsa sp. SU_196_0]